MNISLPDSRFSSANVTFVFVVLLLTTLSGQAFAANCTAAYTHTDTGSSSNYTLTAGQSLKIASGTYTGALDGFASGSSVCVETGATFTPSNINVIAGTLTNYGTTNLQTFVYNTGAVIDNYSTLSFPGGLNTNGATTFHNRANATMNMVSSFQLGNGSAFINDGLLVTKQDFNTQSGTTLTNNYRMEVEGNFNPDGKVDNYGRVYAKKFMNINANSNVSNYCTLVSYDGFNNNSPLMNNLGTILITTATGTPGGPWQNNQAFHNGSSAKVAGGNFINNSTFTGGGSLIFSGDTRNQGTFTGNSTSDKINFYDATPTGTQVFDFPFPETMPPTNTVHTAFTRPTELDAPTTCTNSYKAFASPVTNDYGDAPATYGDAGHNIVAGIHLGALPPDAESASQYSFNAAGDGAEDDGAPHPVSPSGPTTAARFPVLKLTDTTYSSMFTVTNTTGTAGKLFGWIDFDKSGTFEADEAASVSVPTGANNSSVTLTWSSIPADIKLGTTFIRLRLTTDTTVTSSTPTSIASNGEVEDYPIAIYQPVPANSPNLSIVTGITPTACTTTVFTDNFNDLGYISWGAERPGSQSIRNWIRAGGGTDTYADIEDKGATPSKAVYFGNGTMRGISPSIPNGFTFDANGKLTTPITAIALRDVPDDTGVSHWGPQPVTLSTSVPTVIGKAYRLYFKAIPETDPKAVFTAGIMRVDIKGATTESIHFKAPGSTEPNQDYAIEFTATAATSTITFVNYGHADDQWCDTQTTDWCTEGGTASNLSPNELIIDDVVVAAVDACDPPPFPTDVCGQTLDNPLELDFSGTAVLVSGTAKQVGSTYRFSNVASNIDALVTLNALQVDSLPRWLDGDLGGQMQGSQADKFFDMTVNLVKTGTSTAISPVDLILTSFDIDGLAAEPYSDGIEYFAAATTFTGTGSKLQASNMGGSVRYTLPLSARGVDDLTAIDPTYAAGAVYTNVSSFRTKGLVVDDNGSSTRSVFIYANGAAFKKFGTLQCAPEVAVSNVSGTVFEDVNFGGGIGRAFGTAGTVGISGARVELYDAAGKFLTSTTTTAGGTYSFATLPNGNYYVRVVSDSVSSSRLGSSGAELAVQTYRRNNASAVTNEIGGRNPAVADASANTSSQTLDLSKFTLSSGVQAQSVQAVSVSGGSVAGVSFGFNFDTVVNTNNAGQGSLRQFLLNAGLLDGDSTLAQANGYVAGKENAILMLPTTDPHYTANAWTITLNSALPNINDPVVLDGTKQAGFTNRPVLVLNGGTSVGDGLTLHDGSNGSVIQALAINNFKGAGIRIVYSHDNLIGGESSEQGNVITGNAGDGIALDTTAGVNNIILGNSTYNNGGLGIDLKDDGVTVNDANDADTGANQLLNMPILNQVIVNGSELTIRGCATAGASLELFEADVSPGGAATAGANQFGLSHDYGEGQRYLTSFSENSAADIDTGTCDLPLFDGHNNTGMEAFQLTLALPAGVAVGDKLTATTTIASTGTSEFSPSITAEGAPPNVGGGSCAATGGTDILFIVDNSGSITTSEYADFSNTIKNVGTQLLADNPANRIGIAHFGGPSTSLVSGGQYVYFERDFSSTAMNAPIRKFGTNGTYNVNWWADHLAGAVQQIRYAIDGNASTTSSYIVSPLKEMARNTAAPLQIVLMTDAVRYANLVPNDISMLIDPSGSGAEPNDGSDYTVYNQLKTSGIAFSVVSFNPNPVDIAASAAIASVGGTYTGTIDPNPKDPDGSQKSPRRYISVTSGFQLTTEQIDTVVEGTAVCSSAVSGLVFEDINYGGGAARSSSEAGTVGIEAATVEFYNKTGGYIASTTTDNTGHYKLPNLPDDTYYVRVVSDSVNSNRIGSNGTEVPVPTYPTVGGKQPAGRDAGANSGTSSLNVTNFTFTGGALNGQQAQAVQQIVLTGDSLQHVDFGFNFSTIVNANDSGQGSLRQFLLNANLLGGDSTLLQQGRTQGKENAILMLTPTDPNYDVAGKFWSIKLQSALPDITAPMLLDSSTQSGFIDKPVIELKGNSAGAASNGLTLKNGSNGSSIRYLSINGFGGDGVTVTGNTSGNSILSNAIYNNGGLGIDLNNDGVTTNDAKDVDTGPNDLLNYPGVQAASFATNGSKIITYNFTLDLPANTNGYRLEFFKNTAKDPSGNGEGQVFLGSKDFTHPGTGVVQFKGSFNANQAVTTSDFIAITVTEKLSATSFGSTSEFSGVANNNTVLVCTSLIDNTSAALPDMMIDENPAVAITYLSTKDSSGNPVTYVISGGADGDMFTVGPVTNGTLDCAQIQFIKTVVVKSTTADTRAIVSGIPDPGNFEVPMDKNKDNVYDLEVTATDSKGKKYMRTLSVRVMNVNEAPFIVSNAAASIEEDGVTQALDVQSQDPDGETEGNGLSYTLSGGADASKFSLDTNTGVLNFKAVPDYDAPTDSNRDNLYEVQVSVTDRGGLTASKTFSITVLNRVTDDGVKLQIRAFLQGAYDSTTGLMAADLNTLGLVPTNQPYKTAPFNYAGTETLGSLLKTSTGNSAVVDWLLIELRSSPTTVISQRAVMLQRDGNLVDAQTGSSTLHFAGIKPGNYYVSVRHRNHLGVISASPVSLSGTEKLVDFTLSSTAVKGTDARYVSGSLALLWVGDINSSNTLTSSGPSNDMTNLLSSVITHQDNPQAYTNFTLHGYLNTDLNMDGKTLFSGPNNDANALMGNVIMHPQNSNFAANYIVRGGLQ